MLPNDKSRKEDDCRAQIALGPDEANARSYQVRKRTPGRSFSEVRPSRTVYLRHELPLQSTTWLSKSISRAAKQCTIQCEPAISECACSRMDTRPRAQGKPTWSSLDRSVNHYLRPHLGGEVPVRRGRTVSRSLPHEDFFGRCIFEADPRRLSLVCEQCRTRSVLPTLCVEAVVAIPEDTENLRFPIL